MGLWVEGSVAPGTDGWRGSTSLAKRIEYDLYYIENWSLALDLTILWLTLRYGLRRRNAY